MQTFDSWMERSPFLMPIVQIVGFKNSGKTTLACKLIEALTASGLRVGSAKHDAHEFDLDDSGTDSARQLEAGAVETVLTSGSQTRWMSRTPATLIDIVKQLYGKVDILIAEGFKDAPYPKIALIREPEDLATLWTAAQDVRIWVSWQTPDALEAAADSKQATPALSHLRILSIFEEDKVLQEAVTLALTLHNISCSRHRKLAKPQG
ncbi:molybdopterin-guanine dinucleotide biosynthesis protein B [Gorillibacterium massiliense]|uniref:molybdopterin-guanine dinucleotide biosynthesis protein B n=1 Tax=Gorillibacterium massiliense TaxID=1280390 RepID=UPI0004B9CA2B|nr:molybdopterin-guanine dinucleotide biosynthesis protein B [Gorillibacterium massiliense]